jgi:ribosomal protein L40E
MIAYEIVMRRDKMVYCSKCGTKNPDDAKVCSQCGAPLYAVAEAPRQTPVEGECYGTSRRGEPYRRVEGECFGIPRGGTIVAIIVGILIVLGGVSIILQEMYNYSFPWWPVVIIVFGVLILIGAMYGLRRRH